MGVENGSMDLDHDLGVLPGAAEVYFVWILTH